MSKIYNQVPTNDDQSKLFEAGYRVKRDESRKIFATAPDGSQIYSGSSVPDAWTYCDIHAHPEKYQVAQQQPAPTFKKIYFAGSIRGGREMQPIYNQIILHLKGREYEVLSEHVGSTELNVSGEQQMTDAEIYQRDITWILEADAVIADVTIPSLGVGYEVAFARFVAKKPILCVAQQAIREPYTYVSAMIAGSGVKLLHYEHAEHLETTVDLWLMMLKEGR